MQCSAPYNEKLLKILHWFCRIGAVASGDFSEVINFTVKDEPADGVPRQHPDGLVDGAAEVEVEVSEDVIGEIPDEGVSDVQLTKALVEERTAELLEN